MKKEKLIELKKNPEKYNEYRIKRNIQVKIYKQNLKKDPERYKISQEKRKLYFKKYYNSHKEEISKYYYDNKETISKKSKEWRIKTNYCKKYYNSHKEEYKARRLADLAGDRRRTSAYAKKCKALGVKRLSDIPGYKRWVRTNYTTNYNIKEKTKCQN